MNEFNIIFLSIGLTILVWVVYYLIRGIIKYIREHNNDKTMISTEEEYDLEDEQDDEDEEYCSNFECKVIKITSAEQVEEEMNKFFKDNNDKIGDIEIKMNDNYVIIIY